MKKLLILLLSSTFCVTSLGGEVDDSCDLPESLCKLDVSFNKSDKELNDVYKLIMNNIVAGELSDFLVAKSQLQKTLISSQRSWLKFKETNCNAFYTLHSAGGQRNEARMECEINMTNQRIEYLRQTYY